MLALKGNQGTLYEDVKTWFEEREHENHASYQTVDGHKGRIETRSYTQNDDIAWLKSRHPDWPDLTTIGRVIATRELGGKTTTQTRYFISSMSIEATKFGDAIRAHWAIENELHWVLDVTFRDDDSRVRMDQGPANLSIIKHAAMNYLKRAKNKKSLRVMRKIAGWNDELLAQIITK